MPVRCLVAGGRGGEFRFISGGVFHLVKVNKMCQGGHVKQKSGRGAKKRATTWGRPYGRFISNIRFVSVGNGRRRVVAHPSRAPISNTRFVSLSIRSLSLAYSPSGSKGRRLRGRDRRRNRGRRRDANSMIPPPFPDRRERGQPP